MRPWRFLRPGRWLLVILGLRGGSGLGAQPATWEPVELTPHFRAFDAGGCFVGFDESPGRGLRHDAGGCGRGFLPASTFKILNSLIVLETGVLDDEEELVGWDGVDRGWSEWNRDHNLASAFRYSAVWVYQELARRVGEKRMTRWVRRVGYGNADIRGGVDRFWLEGGLRISPEGQVAFLRRLGGDDLPFSPEVMASVRRIMLLEEGEGWVLRAKTGWARPREGVEVGWKVGWVERPSGRFFFAVLILPSGGEFPMRRAQREITRGILADLAVLPKP